MTTPDDCYIKCGDGLLYPGIEVCDDGSDDGEGCSIGCMGVNPAWICTGGDLVFPTTCNPRCNDGIRVGTETCDTGIPWIDGWRCKSTCIGNYIGWDC